MAREKNKRNLSFKPLFTEFCPIDVESTGISYLLDEEIEALYLMDILDLYQEEASVKMEVSRPTFTRILKNARKKLSQAIISGHKITIENSSNEHIVAICSANDSFKNITNNQKYIFIYCISKQGVTLKNKIENPLYHNTQKPAIVLPHVFIQHNINIFVSSKIGEGLKNTLISKGIKSIIKTSIDKEKLISLI